MHNLSVENSTAPEKSQSVALMLKFDPWIRSVANKMWNKLPPDFHGFLGEDDLWQEGRLGFLVETEKHNADPKHINLYMRAARCNMVDYMRAKISRSADIVRFVNIDDMEDVLHMLPQCENQIFLREIIEKANLTDKEMDILGMWLNDVLLKDIASGTGKSRNSEGWISCLVQKIKRKIIRTALRR